MRASVARLMVVLMPIWSALGANLQAPEPPHQNTPWRPTGRIPANILSAVRVLFKQGFPDPRGCEYRNVQIEVSSVWDGKGSVAQTRGWVLHER